MEEIIQDTRLFDALNGKTEFIEDKDTIREARVKVIIVETRICKGFKFYKFHEEFTYKSGQPFHIVKWLIVKDSFVAGKKYAHLGDGNCSDLPIIMDGFGPNTVIVVPRIAVEGYDDERDMFFNGDEDAYIKYLVAKLFSPVRVPLKKYFRLIGGKDVWIDYRTFNQEIVRELMKGVRVEAYSSDTYWWDWDDMYFANEMVPQYLPYDEWVAWCEGGCFHRGI